MIEFHTLISEWLKEVKWSCKVWVEPYGDVGGEWVPSNHLFIASNNFVSVSRKEIGVIHDDAIWMGWEWNFDIDAVFSEKISAADPEFFNKLEAAIIKAIEDVGIAGYDQRLG